MQQAAARIASDLDDYPLREGPAMTGIAAVSTLFGPVLTTRLDRPAILLG